MISGFRDGSALVAKKGGRGIGRRGDTVHGHGKGILRSMCVRFGIQESHGVTYLSMIHNETHWYAVIQW